MNDLHFGISLPALNERPKSCPEARLSFFLYKNSHFLSKNSSRLIGENVVSNESEIN